jgi:hypothetical protein
MSFYGLHPRRRTESSNTVSYGVLLMRGLSGARVEIGLATMAYNIKRITNVLGATNWLKRFIRPDRAPLLKAQSQFMTASARAFAFLYPLLD